MKTIQTPYYAVIFSSLKSDDLDGYDQAAQRMQVLSAAQPGYLGMVHAVTDEGVSVSTSYWQDLASISAWKAQSEHLLAQKMGKKRWYDEFTIEIARVERAYCWQRSEIKAEKQTGVDGK